MKRFSSQLLLLFLAGTCAPAMAQEAMFAGKVTDIRNEPIPGARIKVSHYGKLDDEVQADKNGLYNTQKLPACNYNIDVVANDKHIRGRRVSLDVGAGTKLFYNLKVADNKLEVEKTVHDPYMETTFRKIAEEQKNVDFGMARQVRIISKEDSVTEKSKIIQSVIPMPVAR